MPYNLSICIPTYNRAGLIGGCVESILSQINARIEIVIVDGASRDNTQEIIAGYCRRFPCIRYFRRATNLGVDEDILKIVELAKGDYCWLMSDDDRMEPGAIEYLSSRLGEYPDLAGASVNSLAFDRTMSYRVKTVPATSGGRFSADHLFTNREECFNALGIHLGYLSAQIVRRDLWRDVVTQVDLAPYKNTCWLLVYIIGAMLQRNSRWLYIHRPCIRYRSGNDSFGARMGTYRRQLVTHQSYSIVINGLFGKDGNVCRNILKTLISDRMPRTLANTKANGASIYLQMQLCKLYTKEYWRFGTYWWKVFPLFFVPNFAFRIIRAVYMHVKSRQGIVPLEETR